MTKEQNALEYLRREADKLGYMVIKKPERIKLLPCRCGKKPELWFSKEGKFYKCSDCNIRGDVANTETRAKKCWNERVVEQ